MEVINDEDDAYKDLSNAPLSHQSHAPQKLKGFGKRHTLAILGCIGFSNVYALRVNLSVALVAMVNSTYANVYKVSSHECNIDGSTSGKVHIYISLM